MNNKKYLESKGVSNPVHQKIIIERLPCGIKSVKDAEEDETNILINGPRAIMVITWKGIFSAFIFLEREQAVV